MRLPEAHKACDIWVFSSSGDHIIPRRFSAWVLEMVLEIRQVWCWMVQRTQSSSVKIHQDVNRV